MCSLRLFQLKLKDKQYKQKTSPKNYQTQIKIEEQQMLQAVTKRDLGAKQNLVHYQLFDCLGANFTSQPGNLFIVT